MRGGIVNAAERADKIKESPPPKIREGVYPAISIRAGWARKRTADGGEMPRHCEGPWQTR